MGGHVEGQHKHVLGRDRQHQEDQKQMVLKRKCNRNCVYLIDCILGQPCLKTLSVKLCKDLQQHQGDEFDPAEDLLNGKMRSSKKCLKPELLPFIPNPTCDELSKPSCHTKESPAPEGHLHSHSSVPADSCLFVPSRP